MWCTFYLWKTINNPAEGLKPFDLLSLINQLIINNEVNLRVFLACVLISFLWNHWNALLFIIEYETDKSTVVAQVAGYTTVGKYLLLC